MQTTTHRTGVFPVIKLRQSTIIVSLIALMFLADAANTLLVRIGSPFWRISIFVRGFSQVYFLGLLLIKGRERKLLTIILLLFVIFITGALVINSDLLPYNWFENFNIFDKLIFVFICWASFHHFFQTDEERNYLFRIFEIIILVESLLIILGFLFKIELFSSYGQDYRFGYKGVIPARNELSGFFLIALFYFLWVIRTQGRGIIQLFIVISAGLFTGAKVALLLPIIAAMFLLRWLINKPRKIFIFIGIVFIVIGVVSSWQRDYIVRRLSPTFTYFQQQLAYGHNPNIFSIFMSGRDLYVQEQISVYTAQFNPGKLLFGGFNLADVSTETDLIDLFLFLGLAGVIGFYSIYLRILFYNENGRVSFTQIVFILTWLGVSLLAGHLIFSAVNSAYLAILLMAFSWTTRKKQINRIKIII